MSACGIIGAVKTYQTLLCAFAFFAAFADGLPFDRYQTIIDRKPFGPEPANFDPEAAPGTASSGGAEDSGEMTPEQRSAEEQKLATNVRISILNVAPDGTVKVGFTDSSVNPVENYYLKVGGSQNGWTVKSAEPATESVTLEKDGVEVTMKLGEGVGGKGGSKDAVKGGVSRRGLAHEGLVGGRGGGMRGGSARMMGGLARLRQHRAEMEAKQREDAERKREADAAVKAEQEAREAAEAAERQREAEERAQQREALLQIQEQLRKQREEREAARQSEQESPE